MPGKVVGIRIEQGQEVNKGDVMVVLSAMKMETNVTAPVNGVVKSIDCSQDMQVTGGDLLVTLEPQ